MTDEKETLEVTSDAHPLVGLHDGAEVVLPGREPRPTGEKVVYEYDEQDNFIGWHKEVIK